MSLKAFHVFFVSVSILLGFGFGAWEIYSVVQGGGGKADLVMGIISLVAGVGLIFYLRAVLRKLKNISYL